MDNSFGRFFIRPSTQGNNKAPHYSGEIDLSPELIQQIAAQPGGFRLRIVGWDKQGNKGPWISLAVRADQIQPGHPDYRPPWQPNRQSQQGYSQPQQTAGRPTQRQAPQQQARVYPNNRYTGTPQAQQQRIDLSRGNQRPFNDDPNFYPGDDAPWDK